MILQALCGYYQRAQNTPGEQIIPPGYAMAGASAEIVLAPDGSIVAVNSLLVVDPKDKKGKKLVPRQLLVPLPPKRSGKNPAPAFLYETPAFLFGIYKEPEGAAYRFEASSRIHQEILHACDDGGARALLAFFERRTPGSHEQAGVDTTLLETTNMFVVFRLRGDGVFLHDRPAIRQAWDAYNLQKSEGAELVQCLITGEMAPLARLHGNISGFGADKPTLVGFNQPAFTSFGKSQGANAPVGERAAFEYVTALNMLVKDWRHNTNLAGDKVLFWAERDADLEEAMIGLLLEGADRPESCPQLDAAQRDRIAAILSSLYQGGDPKAYPLDEKVPFFLLGIAANKTRLVIRFFYQSPFDDLLKNLMRHYTDIAIVGARYRFPSPYFILVEMALERKRENVPDSVDAALMRAIMGGTPYPWPLYQGVLRRIRAEGKVTALRAGILKGTINRQAQKEVLKMALDPNEKDVAYVLGRLFALCEKSQKDALGDVNSSIADKYLNAALASPQMVFPTLMKLNQAHTSKTDNYYLKNKITEVIGLLSLQPDAEGPSAFPESLDANGQGKFIVGYYHQMQDLYTKKTPGDAEPDDPSNQDEA